MKTNLAVFFGCSSVEHEVSIISAVQAMEAMDREKYNVVPLYVGKDGDMFTGEGLLKMSNYKELPALLKNCQRVHVVRENGRAVMREVSPGRFKKKPPVTLDVAFPIVHGTNCEDGTLQGYFEMLGIPYVGCDVLSSALGMDKAAFKHVLAAHGLPVLPCVSFTARRWTEDKAPILEKIQAAIGYPCIVKPVNLGSSVGISKADSPDRLEEAVSLASSFAGDILVERAVENLREINCAALGDRDECQASVCEEPVMSDEILSYQDKYMSGGSKDDKLANGSKGMSSLKRRLPAEIPEEKAAEIQELAKDAFMAIGGAGVARIDFLMDVSDGNRVYVNEINTIPGSLAFYLWEAAGIPYRDLIDRLVELAFKRARRRANLMFTIETNLLSQAGDLGGSKGKA
ncbi:MAG: D-alanine--D-alanine ligase [Clostridiales bacterium]|nr:D-alanine--D-alanine ligase [Clostridiales bacterium]